jgi:hypothetical protein
VHRVAVLVPAPEAVMTLCQAYAAMTRVNNQIVTAPNSVALGALLEVRASLKIQINQGKGAR